MIQEGETIYCCKAGIARGILGHNMVIICLLNGMQPQVMGDGAGRLGGWMGISGESAFFSSMTHL